MDMRTEIELYYFNKEAHDNGFMSDETWAEYCMVVLDELMKENKKVLDRLKNM